MRSAHQAHSVRQISAQQTPEDAALPVHSQSHLLRDRVFAGLAMQLFAVREILPIADPGLAAGLETFAPATKLNVVELLSKSICQTKARRRISLGFRYFVEVNAEYPI